MMASDLAVTASRDGCRPGAIAAAQDTSCSCAATDLAHTVSREKAHNSAVFTAGSTLTPLEGAPAAVFTAGSCSPPRRGFFGLFATLETPDAGSLGASMGFSALRPRL